MSGSRAFAPRPVGTTTGTVAAGNHTHPTAAVSVIFNGGRYYWPQGGRTTAVQIQSQTYYLPLWCAESVTLDRIGIEITSASGVTAGHVTRLGIWADNGNGIPGNLLLDAGTVASDTAATVEATINYTISTPGLYWLSGTPQGAGTQPTYRCVTGTSTVHPVGALTLASATGATVPACYTQTGVTGALTSPASLTSTAQAGLVVVVRAAAGQ